MGSVRGVSACVLSVAVSLVNAGLVAGVLDSSDTVLFGGWVVVCSGRWY